MEELDLLKKDWKKNEHSFPKITEQEIYAMLHKKSSSIVKWIFIISILEMIAWSLISFFTADENYLKTLESYHIKTLVTTFTVINYIVIFSFIFLFYRNFKSINTTDSVKSLMKNILKTRKTVQYYIWYNLVMIGIIFITMMVATCIYDERFNRMSGQFEGNDQGMLFWMMILGFTIVFFGLFVGVIWLFYRLVYGFLLRRLYKNYEELKKIDL
ncbi:MULTISPECIES: hypothetical protein [Flavobacterium]|jgi:hypothetical protein|uniref:Uncharacterized protein n=1 Tax=Flavobacterium supellecticarium TaxID=2565924 RepID=A0A4S3ZPV5_9FLAO|nr:hypothetical protein [Flavobacterium supellecticarium]MPT33752.1 hypothetical protein [Flavobacterium sp.]THF47474.1 hypothetical protein E6C50_17090 [Flavobacterium supellecticarium]